MLVHKLTIEEFRGIKSCKEPINLSPFTVLIGRNNSGKSTILEALSLLPSPNIDDGITGKLRMNSLLDLRRSKLGGYKPLLYLYAGSSTIKYYFKDEILELQINEDSFRTKVFEREIASNPDFAEFFHTKPDQTKNLVLFIHSNTSIIQSMENKMDTYKELIMKKGYHVDVAKILNECVDDEYSDIVFNDTIRIRKVLPDNFVYIPLNDLGSGAEKAVKIMSLIEVIKPKLLLIDDFEAGLHPSLIKTILKWLKDKKWQTVLSTHSIDVLDKLIEINPADATVLLLKKSHDDVLSHKIFTLEKLENYINANTDPRLLPDALDL
jgi:AAA15 family ATPase/GTPase